MTAQSEVRTISNRLAAYIQDYILENGIKPSTLSCVRWAFDCGKEDYDKLEKIKGMGA